MTSLSPPVVYSESHGSVDWQVALNILRDAGAEINRLGPETSLTEALQLIAETAVRLVGSDPADRAAAVIYTYDASRGAFDADSRVSAGEGELPLVGDTPRPDGVGANALARRSRVLSYEESRIAFHPLKYRAGIRTAACYPLLVSGQPVGALYIDLRSDRRFTDDELLLLDTFVQLAAVAIYNTRQFEGINRALQRKVDELERLQRAERWISSRRNLEDTLHEILQTALKLTEAEHGSFRLLDKSMGALRLGAIVPAVDEAGWAGVLEVSERSSVMGWVAKHCRPVRIGDLREAPWSEIYRPLHPQSELRSELAVPLFVPGVGLEGDLNIESPSLAAFDADDQRVLEALATQAVIAIQEAKLLDAIADIAGRLVDLSPDALFALLLAHAGDLLNVPHAAIWDLDPSDRRVLLLRASTGGFPPQYRVPVLGSLLGTAVTSRRPVVCADLGSDPRLTRRELVQQMGWASALVVPLVVREGTPCGAFAVYTTEPRSFSDWDVRLLTCLASYAAVALQQAEALEQVKLAKERQAVAETFAVLGDVAANLLHRVNNLVGVIPVRVQGIADRCPAAATDAYLAAGLSEIEDSARAAMATARETMTYLRPLRLQPVSAGEAFQAAIARMTIPPHIQLAEEGLADLPPVQAGVEQLRLVLVNLIENALDALGERPGHIVVSGRVAANPLNGERPWAEISVADDGPGVSAEDRERIFDPEFSTKRSAKKMGFGLWWVKSWVQRFGGAIELAEASHASAEFPNGPEPRASGGCVFIIRLPLAEGGART